MDLNTIRKTEKNVAAIILAAGLGTRMESRKAKVLHELNGQPMVTYVVETAKKCVKDNIVLVIGNQAETVRNIVSQHFKVNFGGSTDSVCYPVGVSLYFVVGFRCE